VLEAAIAAGAPEHIIGWIDEPTVELSQALMQHPDIKLILATGGPGMVKAAYSSGHPSLGVGAGNTPAVIDETADIETAVSSILLSKTFDNGMICASEQSVVVVDSIYDQVKQEFINRGAYFLSPGEKAKVGEVLLRDGRLNPAIVGQSVEAIAQLACIDLVCLEDPGRHREKAENLNPLPCTLPKVLIAEVEEIGVNEPFSYEKLSPILAMYRANSFLDAVEKAKQLVEFGGQGHTSVLYINPNHVDDITYFKNSVKTSRLLINTPSSQGAIGDLYNFKLDPSLTLGCGTGVAIRYLIT
jgi:NAD-dependent aldehyde dehydrogenases